MDDLLHTASIESCSKQNFRRDISTGPRISGNKTSLKEPRKSKTGINRKKTWTKTWMQHLQAIKNELVGEKSEGNNS